MRLWHIDLLTKLPQKQLCGQWRECAALMGNGWGRKHSVVNYVFTYPEEYLVAYSIYVMKEMLRRKYHPNHEVIFNSLLKRHTPADVITIVSKAEKLVENNSKLFNEHNEDYMMECLLNLKSKNIIIDF